MHKNTAGAVSIPLIILLVIVFAAAAFGIYSLVNQPSSAVISNTTNPPTFTPIPMPSSVPVISPTTTPLDTSNTSLDQDLQLLNTKMGDAASASGQVDTSLQNQSTDSAIVQ